MDRSDCLDEGLAGDLAILLDKISNEELAVSSYETILNNPIVIKGIV